MRGGSCGCRKPGIELARRLRAFGFAQGFVDDHLEIGLVAKTAFGGLDAGLGDVFWVEADGGRGECSAFGDGADTKASLRASFASSFVNCSSSP